jgi:plastocyanin
MRRTAGLAALLAALVLAGCGGDDEPAATPAPTEAATTAAPTDTPAQEATSGAETLKIAADPSGAKAFTEKTLQAKAGKVTIEFANQSQLPHAVDIEGVDGATTQTVTGADAPPITVDLEPGTYTYYCPVGDHRDEGMEGKLTVR